MKIMINYHCVILISFVIFQKGMPIERFPRFRFISFNPVREKRIRENTACALAWSKPAAKLNVTV